MESICSLLNEIIRFIKTKCILSIILLIAIWCIVKISNIPLLFPSYFIVDLLFLRPSDLTTLEVFTTFQNISLSYIAAFIFYIITDYIPKYNMSLNSFEIIKNDLISLYLCMSGLIANFKFILQIEKEDNLITLYDVTALDSYKIENKPIYCKKKSLLNGININGTSYSINIYEDSIKYSDFIKDKINDIKSNPSFIYSDFNLLKIISFLSSSNFLRIILELKNDRFILNDIPCSRINFGKYFFEFIQAYNKLSKFSFDKHTYHCENVSAEELQKHFELIEKTIAENPDTLKILNTFN